MAERNRATLNQAAAVSALMLALAMAGGIWLSGNTGGGDEPPAAIPIVIVVIVGFSFLTGVVAGLWLADVRERKRDDDDGG